MVDVIKKIFLNKRIKDKDSILLFIVISIYLILFIIAYVAVGNKTFIINNDSMYQYSIFYEEWIDKVIDFIKSGKFSFYSFTMFLGTDFYSAMGYYCTGDIFLPLLLIFRNNLQIGLLIETIICIYLSAIFMNLFLKKASIKDCSTRIFISLIYAISGQAIIYVQNYMFHRFLTFLPLLFYGVHDYFDNKRKNIFIISTAILFCQNYYFMFPTLIFLFLYCVVECLNRKYKFNEIAKKFICLLLSLIVGFAISAPITLPSMIYIIGNIVSRESSSSLLMWDPRINIGLFFSLISQNLVGTYKIHNIFTTAADNHEIWFNLFITIIPLIFCIKSINIKNKYSSTLLLMLWLIAEIKPFNSFMHGFSIPSLRWIFVLEFYMLFISAKEIDQYIFNNKDFSIKRIFLIILIIFIIMLVALILINRIRFSEYRIHFIYIFVSFACSIIIFQLFERNRCLGYCVSVLFVFCSTLFYYSNVNSNRDYINTLSKDEIQYHEDVLRKDSYYRYYNSYLNSYDHMPLDSNSSYLYDILSTSTYSSTLDPNIKQFTDIANSLDTLRWNVEIKDNNLLTMLGTKYMIAGDAYKDNNEIDEEDYLYKYSLNTYGQFDIYQNNKFIGFGYAAPNLKYFKDYSNDTSDFIKYVLLDDDTFDYQSFNPSYKQLSINKMKDDGINASITLDSKNIVLIPIPNNKGWKIKVNNHIVNPISVNGGFIGLALDKGYNEIEMKFRSPYLTEGLILFCFGVILFVVSNVYEKRYSKQK